MIQNKKKKDCQNEVMAYEKSVIVLLIGNLNSPQLCFVCTPPNAPLLASF